MSPQGAAVQTLPRFVTSIVGPGDPVWHGKPGRDRARRIRAMVSSQDSEGRQYFNDGTGVRQLRTAADYGRLNQILGS